MTDAVPYQARPIKRAGSTKAAVAKRRSDHYDIIAEMQPMTVRRVFYQATVRGIIEKAESGCAKVQTELTLMRRKDLALSTQPHEAAASAQDRPMAQTPRWPGASTGSSAFIAISLGRAETRQDRPIVWMRTIDPR
jgi:hypothetical protein